VVFASLALGGGAATGATQTQLPRAELRDFTCHPAAAIRHRLIAVTAVMRPLRGTGSMQMRFDLLQAISKAGPFTAVSGRGLGRWLSPNDPTIGQLPGDVWTKRWRVRGQPGPAFYRFRVRFRWIAPDGTVLGHATKASRVCRQG
jgi:hypothetical protein